MSVIFSLLAPLLAISQPTADRSDEFARIEQVEPILDEVRAAIKENDHKRLLDLIDPMIEVSDPRDAGNASYLWRTWVETRKNVGWVSDKLGGVRLFESPTPDYVLAHVCIWSESKNYLISNGMMQVRFIKKSEKWSATSVTYVDGGCP